MQKNKSRYMRHVAGLILLGSLLCGCGEEAVEEMDNHEDIVQTVTEEETTESVTQQEIQSDEAEEQTEMISEQFQEEMTEIAEKPDAVKVKGIYVSGPVAGTEKIDELIQLVDETELNAMVIDVKNDDGRVTYKINAPTVSELGAEIGYIRDIDALIKKCKEKDIYLIGRIVAFKDPYLAQQRPELAVKTKTGEIFKDKGGLAWVNPYKQEVWDYLIEIAKTAVHDGFDEIQFDYIRFSTDLNFNKVDFGEEAETVGKKEIITQFTEFAYENISECGAYVSADVYGTVIDSAIDQEIVGQDYVAMASYLDYICPMVYPSHYANGVYGIPIPDAQPYDTVKAAMKAANEQLSVLPKDERAINRVWIQAFTAGWVDGHISYGQREIRQQIQGAYEAGYDEWILWNAAVNYKRNTLLTDEEAEAECQAWNQSMFQEGNG